MDPPTYCSTPDITNTKSYLATRYLATRNGRSRGSRGSLTRCNTRPYGYGGLVLG